MDSDAMSTDANEEVWKSERLVKTWVARGAEREQKRAAQWRLMGELLPFADDEEFTFLDIGAGTGVASRNLLDLFPNARGLLLEFSPQMMAQGRELMAPYEGRYDYVEFDMLAGEWPAAVPAEVGAAVTSQCVHHIPDERKAGLFAEILRRLQPGGWYVNFDPVTPPDAVVGAAWERANERQDPEATEKARHRNADEQLRHANHVRYMIPLEPQLGYLREAGFEAVDIYWKHLDYVIYGGRRPLS